MPAAQVHPLECRDQRIVDRLLAAEQPTDADLVDCARLLLRYQGFPGAEAIQQGLATAMTRWHLDRPALFAATRTIWANGYRPAADLEAEVGSGADVTGG
jgi:hypothetical protein